MKRTKPRSSCPLTQLEVIDLYFMEHRAKLLDIAAFLDRVGRARVDGKAKADHRIAALVVASGYLSDGKPHRARRILEMLSDPTTQPIPAAGMKGATGAWAGQKPGKRRK